MLNSEYISTFIGKFIDSNEKKDGHIAIDFFRRLFPSEFFKSLELLQNEDMSWKIFKTGGCISFNGLSGNTIVLPVLFCSCLDFSSKVIHTGKGALCHHIIAAILLIVYGEM